jgi:hypothetical protein
MAARLAERRQPSMTAVPDVASSSGVSRTDRPSPATPTIDSAPVMQYLADSRMNAQEGQQGRPHSRHVTWEDPCPTGPPRAGHPAACETRAPAIDRGASGVAAT